MHGSGQGQSKAASNSAAAGFSIAPAPPPAGPRGRRSIGLVLGGGGALGLSEVGVLQWFEEHRIPVDMLAGTSMGCMVSALYSTGKSVDDLKHTMDDAVFKSVFAFSTSYKSRSFRRREDSRELPNALELGLKHGVAFRNSVLTDAGLNAFLDRQFVRYGERTEFNNLPIPLRCVATNLDTAQTVTFTRGSLPDAVRASLSLPGIFQPFHLDGADFVDGGVLDNLPTDTMRNMHADVVLAVSLPLIPVANGGLSSLLGILQRSFSVSIEGAERRERSLADVVIMPDLDGFSQTDYLKTIPLAKRGYEAAEREKSRLLPYALDPQQWQQYLDQREEKQRGHPGRILRVAVKTPSDDVTRVVERKFMPLVGQPLQPKQVENILSEIRSDGRFEADYSVTYERPGDERRPVLLVTVSERKTGPPFLLAGINIQAQTAGITRAVVEGILLDQDLGGYGSEFRGHVKLGYLTEVDSEYYRRLRSTGQTGGFFAAPRAGILREPFPIYNRQQQRLAERQLDRSGGGIDIGWSDSRTQELRAGWEMHRISWSTTTGSDGAPNLQGSAQQARLRYAYDTQDRALVPRYGFRSVTSLGYQFSALDSHNAPRLEEVFTVAHALGHYVLAGRLEGGTMLNRNVSQPLRFTLGGPLRLSASAIDEYRGTDYFLVSPAILRRIAHLPAPLGQSIYLGAGYELGQMRAPDASTLTRQDGFFGLIAETPLGVITVAPAIGSEDHRKFIFTLGKLF